MQRFFLETDETRLLDIPGLAYRPEYIAAEEERELAAAIDAEVWDTTWQRRRQLYGGSYGQQTSGEKPMPVWGAAVIHRMSRERICDPPFDHLLVNEYLPGQGISLHVDYKPFDRTVASLSLLAPCVMDLRHAASGRVRSILLAPRSLLVLTDEARYDWEHGIARRKSDNWDGVKLPRRRRLSMTFRLRVNARQVPPEATHDSA